MSGKEKQKHVKEEMQLKSKIYKTEMLINRLQSRVAFLQSGIKPVDLDRVVKKMKGNKWSSQV